MKICFLMDNIHYLGGAQRCTTSLANELAKKGHSVIILCGNKDNSENYTDYNLVSNVKVEYFKGTDFLPKALFCWVKVFEKINNETGWLKNKYNLLNFVYYGRNIFAIKRLQKKFDVEKFDCVIGVGAYYSMLLTNLKKNKTKFIGWQHTTGARHFEIKGFLLWHQECIFKKALSYLDKYVVLTKDDAKYIKDKFGESVDTIYNPTSFETDIKKYDETKTILTVGRYHKVKGFDLLIEAFKIFNEKNKGWKLKIVGDGEERKSLQELINKYGLQESVILTGRTNDVIKEYKNSDFFVLTSRIEGFGIVVVEAMECGLPVVAFGLPCISEILTEKEGMVVECFNTEKLAETMENMAINKELRKEMGLSAKQRAKAFHIKNIVEEWEKVLN